jgi:hypothetical protein
MTDALSLSSLLERIGPLASDDRRQREKITAEEAPEFHALSFFNSREVVVSQILAYLLTPTAQHGQGDLFLKSMLKALGVPIRKLQSVVVQAEAPCYTLSGKRRMDIFIRFGAAEDDTVVAIESKSHFAGDQPGQVRDYLAHLKKAYLNSHKHFYYLNRGNEPEKESITSNEWQKDVAAGICEPKDFRKVMSEWLEDCREHPMPPKILTFLDDFAIFIGMVGGKAMTKQKAKRTREEVLSIIEITAPTTDRDRSHLDAILEVYAMHDEIWQKALRKCMTKVLEQLNEQLAGWEISEEDDFEDGGCYELTLSKKMDWKPSLKGEPKPAIILASEDGLKVRDHKDGRSAPTHLELRGTYPGKRLTRLALGGIDDISSADGIRYLLRSQGVTDIVNEIVRFIEDE